jgi:hypothetical protein
MVESQGFVRDTTAIELQRLLHRMYEKNACLSVKSGIASDRSTVLHGRSRIFILSKRGGTKKVVQITVLPEWP